MGISANAVAALAVRAREGLKQAYLQNHVSTADAGCSDFAGGLGSYVRGGLTRRRAAKVDAHLQGWLRCAEILLHLNDVGGGMRAVILPAIVGLSVSGTAVAKGSGVAFGLGKVAAGGPKSAGAAAGTFGSVGAVAAASAVGLVLIGAVVAGAVAGSAKEVGRGPDPASPSGAASPVPSGDLPTSAAQPYLAANPAFSAEPSAAPAPLSTRNHQDPDHGVQARPLAHLGLATAEPAPTAVTSPSQIPSAPPPTPREPAAPNQTPSPGASPAAAATTPVPSATPTPEGGEISATATIVRWSFPSSTVRVSLSNTNEAELSNAVLSFKMPRYWLDLPQTTYGPAGWRCLDTSSVMLGQSVCTASSWAHVRANFDLTVPTMSILNGYQMEISATALGVSGFTTSMVIPPPN